MGTTCSRSEVIDLCSRAVTGSAITKSCLLAKRERFEVSLCIYKAEAKKNRIMMGT